jgi:hypothetical protein
MFSVGEIEEYNGEYHGYLEEQKRQAFQSMNQIAWRRRVY